MSSQPLEGMRHVWHVGTLPSAGRMKVESIELSNFTISVQNTVRFILIPTTVIETHRQDGLQKGGGGM